MKCEDFTLGFCNRSESRLVVRSSENIGCQAGVRTGRRAIVDLLRRNLFLNVFRVDELVKRFNVLDEDVYHARIKRCPGHVLE